MLEIEPCVLDVIDAKKDQLDFLNYTLAYCIEREAGLTYKEIFKALEGLSNKSLIGQIKSKRITH